MEPPYDNIKGVISTTSGYTGGSTPNPTYQEVSSGTTGHTEAVQVVYDPEQVTYEQLLSVFWRNIDPTAENRQFVDVGSQYRAAVFYHSEEQRQLAEASKQRLMESGRFDRPILTPILPAGTFFAAEDYHQDYYKKNPTQYKFYRNGSGRDRFLETIWGDDAKPE